jgi:uncharacterized protein YjdB
MVRSSLVRSRAALGMLFAMLSACEQRQVVDPGSHPDADRLVVSISPKRDSLVVGATLGLHATVLDARGVTRTDQAIRWSSLAPNIASVDGVGLVTGIAVGTAPVVAMVGLGAQVRADTAVLVVQAGTLRLSIVPEFAEITLGDSLRLEATFHAAGEADVRGLSVQWSTSDATVATVSQDGVVTSLSPGDATLTGRLNGLIAAAMVRVLPNPVQSISVAPANLALYPGETVQLVATVRDARGKVLPASNVRWSASSSNVVVTQDGILQARSMGSAFITATVDDRSASATAIVLAVPAAVVSVTAAASSVPQGGRLSAVATARDAEGNVLSGKSVAWSSSNPAVAQVDADGTITGLVIGTTSIHAIIDSKIGSMPVSVVSATPTSISVVPATAAVSLGKTAQLTAEVRDQGGNIVPSSGITWTSGNPGVATVTSSGLVTAVASGTANITASAGALSMQATITVILSSIASVSVAPNASQIQVGGKQQLSANVTAASGGQVPNAAVAWSSSNPTVVSVSALGVASGISAGNATITATSSGVQGTASITVTNPAPLPVSSVTVTFNSPSLVVGQVTQAIAVARDAKGNTIAGKTVVWSSDDAPLASVSTTGLVTAIAAGTATIEALIDGVLGYATISIGAPTPLPVHTVQLTIAPSTINAGQTATSSIILRDSLGRTLFGRTIGWASNKPSVATVGLGGVITGVAAGVAGITATSEGKSGSAVVTVNAIALPSVATVTVSAVATRLTPGQSTQATATARDAAGNVLAGHAVTWLSSNPAAAAVTSTGRITGIAVGATTVTATAGGKSGSVVITVVSASTASVIVPASIDATGTQDVSAQLQTWLNSLPDSSRIVGPAGARYRVEFGLMLEDRRGLQLDAEDPLNPPTLFQTQLEPYGPADSENRNRLVLGFRLGGGHTLRNWILRGAQPNSGANGLYDPDLEAQHGLLISGVNGMLVEDVRITEVAGDFIYLTNRFANNVNSLSQDITIRRVTGRKASRQGVAVVGAARVLIEDSDFQDIRRSAFDIEPNGARGSVQYLTVRRTIFGTFRNDWVAGAGSGEADIHDITFENNEVIGRPLVFSLRGKTATSLNPAAIRRSNIRVANNRARNITSITTTSMTVMQFSGLDNVEVIGNIVEFTGQKQIGVGAYFDETCGIAYSGNKWGNAQYDHKVTVAHNPDGTPITEQDGVNLEWPRCGTGASRASSVPTRSQ